MRLLAALFLLSLTACVGTDAVNDEIVSLSISVEETVLVNNAAATNLGNNLAFNAVATNDRGTTYQPNVEWNSSNNAVATINENGNLQAIAPGTTRITATASSIQSDAITISVVQNNDDVALIEITGASSMIDIDERTSLTVRALDINRQEVPDAPIALQSENDGVASVNAEGEVTGLSEGETMIIARSGDISSSFSLSVGRPTSRTGTFEGVSGYSVEGGVALEIGSENTVLLQLQDDFRSSSGPGLFIYLTNNGTSISGGIEIGELRSSSGNDTYSVPANVTLDEYNQVLIFCKPFGVPFGVAELNSGSE